MSDAKSADASQPRTFVVDLGKKKRDQVKKLRKGKGKLVGRIESLVADMKESGEVNANADTLIIVVERKGRKAFPF